MKEWAFLSGRSYIEYETLEDAVAALEAGNITAIFIEKEKAVPLIEESNVRSDMSTRTKEYGPALD